MTDFDSSTFWQGAFFGAVIMVFLVAYMLVRMCETVREAIRVRDALRQRQIAEAHDAAARDQVVFGRFIHPPKGGQAS